MTNLPRELATTDPELLAVFNDLLSGRTNWPLYLHGLQGRGKTTAALALCDHVPGSIYLTVPDMNKSLLGLTREQEKAFWESFRPPKCLLVVLDELGTRDEKDVSATHYENVQKMFDIRYTYPLIVISKHPIARITKLFDDSMGSRAEAGTVYELTGPDRRIVC